MPNRLARDCRTLQAAPMISRKSGSEPRFSFLVASLLTAVLVAGPVAADPTRPLTTIDDPPKGDPTRQPLADNPTPATPSSTTSQGDFLFGPPKGAFGIRAGMAFPRADSEIFEFAAENLTLTRDDFNSAMIGFDLAFRLNDRLDAVIGLDYSRGSERSEYRDFVDELDLPIVQETRLSQVPLTASLKFYLTSRGRSIGQYAWIPRSVAPYIGAGGGFVWYRFEQFGDFVDFLDLAIFTSEFVSDGWAALAHVFAGIDFKLNTKLALGLETRYSWGTAELDRDFVSFDKIDLAGFRATAGLYWKF